MMLSACTTTDPALPTRVVLPTEQTAMTSQQPTDMPLVGSLVFWEAQRATLSDDAPHVWRFSAFAGDDIAVRVVGISAMLTLMTDTGDLLATGESIRYSLPATGFYRLMVMGDAGIYEIGLSYATGDNPNAPTELPITAVVGIPTPNPLFEELGQLMGEIRPSTAIQQAIRANMRHRYTFMVGSESYVQIEAVASFPETTPRLTLYAPDGTPIAIDGGSGANGSARLRNIRLNVAGEYTVQVIGTADTTYTLLLNITERLVPVIATMTLLPTPTPFPTYSIAEAQPLMAGQRLLPMTPIRATWSRPDGVVVYPFFVEGGTSVTIGMSPLGNPPVRLRLEMVDPNGDILTRATVNGSVSNGDTVIPAFPIQTTGVHQLFVTSEDGTLGDYVLSYGVGAVRLDRILGELPRDQAMNSRVDKRGVRDVWLVELRAGDSITLSATPNDLIFDPILEFSLATRPDDLLARDDNSGGGRAPFIRNVTIPEDGIYLVRVYAKDAASLGDYNVIWRYINRASTPTPPPPATPLLTLRDSVGLDVYAFYPFQGYAGQKIAVQVLGQTDGFDPVAALIAPDGSVLIEADDSDGTLNPSFIFTLPEDGVYRLRVNGYLSAGEFLLLIRELF